MSLINIADRLLAGLDGLLSGPTISDIEAVKTNIQDARRNLDTLLS